MGQDNMKDGFDYDCERKGLQSIKGRLQKAVLCGLWLRLFGMLKKGSKE